MSKEFFQEVAKDIESGEYFEDARSWYHLKYSYPMIERSFCIWFSLFAIFIAYSTLNTLNSFLPMEEALPVAINVYDQASTYSELKKLSPKKESNPDLILQQYLMLQFIRAYESYLPAGDTLDICALHKRTKHFLNENICKSVNMLSTLADKKTLYKFLQRVDVNSYDSYIIKYREGERFINLFPRTIKITTRKKTASDKYTIHQATVELELSETFETSATEIKKSKWLAEVEYIYDNLEYDTEIDDFKPMNFKVINYHTTEVK